LTAWGQMVDKLRQQEDPVRFWIQIDLNSGETVENSTETPTRANFDYFWLRYPNTVLCRWEENGPISSRENLDTTKTVSQRANEKKTQETIGELYTEDDCSSSHKFTLSDLQRTLQYLHFDENRGGEISESIMISRWPSIKSRIIRWIRAGFSV
jgi:hypothetical protein